VDNGPAGPVRTRIGDAGAMSELATEPSTPRGAGRDAITRAARETFAERGYHGTSVRDIARGAGLSLSALYYWHPSKQHLLAALVEEFSQDYFQRCNAALRGAGDDPAERLGALVRTTVEYRVTRRVESGITAREWRNLDPGNRERLDGLRRAATRLWADLIADGVARGAFRCAHPDDARRTIVAACNAIAQWYEPGGGTTPDELAERYTAIALRIVDHGG
jgi:AcrR family transcriptional regulator